MGLHPCVKDGLDELFGEGTAATATTVSVIGLFADQIAKKVLRTKDAQHLFEHFTAKTGLVSTLADFFHKVGDGTVSSSDYAAVLHSFIDAGLTFGKLVGSKNPIAMALITATTVAQLLAPFVPCLLPDPEVPDKKDPEKTTSPLVIDLDGNGILTFAVKKGAYFDLNADGFAEKTGWLNGNDVFLALDVNKNGIIDDGSELFGNYTVLKDGKNAENGFLALKDLDSNDDGIFDAKDEKWSEVLLWQDKLNDGYSQESELMKISESGIESIDLNYTNQTLNDDVGNQHLQTSVVHWKDGSTTAIHDVWFKQENANTLENHNIHLSDSEWQEITALPYIEGFGMVSSLYVALSRDPQLKTLVENYLAADAATRAELLNDLIYRWTGSDAIDPYSRDPSRIYGHVMDARQLVSLEKLTGSDYLGTWCWGERDPNPHGQAAPKLIAEFKKFADYVAAQLAAQHDHPELFQKVFIPQWDATSQSLRTDWTEVNAKLSELFDAGQFTEARALLKTAQDLGKYNSHYRADLAQNLDGIAQDNAELGAFLNDAWLIGTDGSDQIFGTGKAEIIVGGKGNDTLHGGAGNDEYRFEIGFGKDRLYDNSGEDRIVFGHGIAPDQIQLSRDLTAVYLTRLDHDGNTTDDVIQIDNFFDFNGMTAEGKIELIRFANGTEWTWQEIAKRLEPKPTDGDDKLYLNELDNVIDALGGNDLIFSGDGNDTITLNSGNNTVYGDNGNDTIISGTGNDHMEGGSGSDTYVFGRDFGQDTVLNFNPGQADTDVITFTDGIRQSDLSFRRHGQDLIIRQRGTDNSITVQKYFEQDAAGDWAVQTIRFADGSSIGIEEVKELVLIPTLGDDTLYAYDSGSVLYGSLGNDTLVSGKGNDLMMGSYGRDSYVFRKGNGQDVVLADSLFDRYANDQVVFEDVQFAEARFQRTGDDLIVTGYHQDNAVTFKDYFFFYHGEGFQSIRFADQTLSHDQILRLNIEEMGSNGNDFMIASTQHSTLYGLDGDDTLWGSLYHDTLIGGKGNDRLEGGLGNDTYVFAKGDGQDYIYDTGGNDTLKFSDLTVNDLWFTQNGNHLEVSVIGSEDKVTLGNHNVWFFGKPNQIEQIETADGSRIDAGQLNKLAQAMASFAPQQNDAVSVPEQMQQYMQQIGAADYWQTGNAGIL